jgi:hypothetical protein
VIGTTRNPAKPATSITSFSATISFSPKFMMSKNTLPFNFSIDFFKFLESRPIQTPKLLQTQSISKFQRHRALVADRDKRDAGKNGSPSYLIETEDQLLKEYLIFKNRCGIAFTYKDLGNLVCLFRFSFFLFFFHSNRPVN